MRFISNGFYIAILISTGLAMLGIYPITDPNRYMVASVSLLGLAGFLGNISNRKNKGE